MSKLKKILYGTSKEQIRALFEFRLDENTDEEIIAKFNLFVRYFFPLQFKHKDAPFHNELDHNNLKVYRGEKDAFVDIVFRGGAKTTRTKLFIAFFLLNDRCHFRKFIKVLTKNIVNAKQVVTDIYNTLINYKIVIFYPELFEKTNKKTVETMGNFIIPTYGIRVSAGQVGVDQRGDSHGEEETARPDFVWCHKKGTKIIDKKGWINVEDHESFKQYRKEKGVNVKIESLPYCETVTKEHRYWVKTIKPARTTGGKSEEVFCGWKEAKDLTNRDYIGYKINSETRSDYPMLNKYKAGGIGKRDKLGRVKEVGNSVFNKEEFKEFNDPEWWWFFGLFWGDGNLAPHVVCVTIANEQGHIFQRVKRLLDKNNIKFSITPNKGCYRLQFSHAVLNRWLKTWYTGGNSRKVPPLWVESIDVELQKKLMLGYIDADGYIDKKGKCVRVTSVCLDGLYSARRILARIGIPSSIRNGIDGKDNYEILGVKCKTQKKYDIRFRENAKLLGFDIENQTRYTYSQTFIEDGFMWSKIKNIEDSDEEEFCPIQTETHDYQTNHGLSHNCDDFETRKTLRSATETKALWDNMEEARTGLSTTGGCIYTCNYLSERGNVHKLITQAKNNPDYILMIIPIIKDGKPTWDLYTLEDIEKMRATDDDFAGERMCEPSAGLDVMFDRETLKNQHTREPRKELAGFKMFYEYNPAHRYGMGADIAGGVGLDSSADVIIDFSTIPARVVGTYTNNMIKPDTYGDELERHARLFGEPIIAPENNKFDMCIGRLKQIYRKIYYTQPKDLSTLDKVGQRTAKTYGWNTNRLTKPKMLFDLKKAVEDGLLELTDINLVNELMSYTRDDLMDTEIDPRLTTRHFDLLTAACIAWAMKDWATVIAKDDVVVTETKNPFDCF